MHMRRLTCLFLALLTALPLISCGSSTAETDTETAAETIAETVEETAETLPPLQVPEDLDYGGYEATIYTFDHSGYRWEHVAEELTGEVLNDAIYNRNLDTEERLNVKVTGVINPWDNENFRTNIMAAVMSASDDYDIITGNTYNSTFLSAEGYYYNVNEMPYIDPANNPWWNESSWRELSVGDKAYLLMGDMCASNYSCEAVFFDKDLIADHGMESPYTLVDENRWTLDQLIGMTEDFYLDLNGNGTRDEEGGDLFGFYGRTHSVCNLAYYYLDITDKTDDNYIEVTFYSEKTEEIFNTLRDWFLSSEGFLCTEGWTPYEGIAEYKNCLFTILSLQRCVALRDYDLDYGIVPIPKYDESQKDYVALASGVVVSFPASASDIERSAAIADTLSYYGRQYVFPAYVENTLIRKGARDEDAGRMVELILDSVAYDFGKEYSSFTGYGCFMLEYMKTNQGFASFYEAWNAPANQELFDAADKILALE